MRPIVRVVLVAPVFAALAAGARAHGVSPRTEPVEAAVDSALAALSTQPPVARKLRAIGRALAKPANAKSLANELKSVAAASRTADGLPALPETDAVRAAFTAASAGYLDDLGGCLATMDLALTAQNLATKARTKITANRAKVAAAVSVATVPDTATSAALKSATAGAKAAAGFTPYDAGGSHAWVVSSLQSATLQTSLDLDGDGSGDNALGQLAQALAGLGFDVDLNTVLLGAVQTSAQVVVIQMWNVHKFQSDPLVFGGVLGAADTDADPSDNFGGTEVFAADPAAVAGDGNARVRAATSIKNGQYEFRLKGQAVTVAGIPIPATGVVAVRGTATAMTNSGTIGVTIPTATLLELLDDAGITIPALFQPTFLSYADIDLDGNGSKDAFSSAFTFGSSPASVSTSP